MHGDHVVHRGMTARVNPRGKNRSYNRLEVNLRVACRKGILCHDFAPDLVGAYQDSDGGDGCQWSSPPFLNGSSSWNGLSGSRFATSCLIREPLALRAFDRGLGAVHVVNSKRDPIVVAEVKFREIAVQVVLAAMLVDALHSALED